MSYASAEGMDSPLVLAVLGDRSFQHLIFGILQRQACQQLEQIGPDVGDGYLPDT